MTLKRTSYCITAKKRLRLAVELVLRFLASVEVLLVVWVVALLWGPAILSLGGLLLLALVPITSWMAVLTWWDEPKLASIKALIICKTKTRGENWTKVLGWFIPRKHRNHIVGDILEDCDEMREAGCTEKRIKFHVVYQWLIAVIILVPTAVKTSIVDTVKQVISPPK